MTALRLGPSPTCGRPNRAGSQFFFDGEFDFSVDDETLVQYHLAVGKRYTAGQYEQLRLQNPVQKGAGQGFFAVVPPRLYPAAQLRQKLEQKLGQQDIRLSDDPAQWLAVLERSDSGYVTRMQVGESQQSGLWLRELLGLRSSDFDWEIQDGNFVFTTRGYGHGGRTEPVRCGLSGKAGGKAIGRYWHIIIPERSCRSGPIFNRRSIGG